MPLATDHARRRALCEWLTAHDIEPHDVPIDGDLTIQDTDEGRVIRCEVFVAVDEAKVVDARGERGAREMRTVPLAVEPPAWFVPYVKPTREQLLASVERVRKLHVRNANSGTCEHCSERDYPGYAVTFPCPTALALDGKE